MPDISLLQVRTPVTQPHGGVGEWWVHERSGRYSLLGLPNCRVIDADLPMPTVQPAGISETTTLSIGDAPDVVYVIRTTDGADVLRKYIARYSRSQVVFFEGGLFGYSERDGTHVLRVPIEAGTR